MKSKFPETRSPVIKGLAVVIVVASVLAMIVSIWAGGRRKWELITASDVSESLSTSYEAKLKENPADPLLKYNLACFYYRQERFKEAEKLLIEVLDAGNVPEDLARKSAYNLGNVLFRQGEQEGSPDRMLPLFQRSLALYKQVLESSRQASATESEGETDTAFNYTLVKQRIKILADIIKKQQADQERKKELFVLLSSLLEREKEIQEELRAITSLKDDRLRDQKRVQLLDMQVENIRQLKVIRERIREAMAGTGGAPGTVI